jgi:uncharacterized protein with HEPN domain
MANRSEFLRLTDLVEAVERISDVVDALSLAGFEASWEKQWVVERGVLIISEASRSKVAAIGSVLRHDYERIAADVIWKLAKTDLPVLYRVCQQELSSMQGDQ